jgi:hypothetical protein
LFLLFGVEAACGKKCCAVQAEEDWGVILDAAGRAIIRCDFILFADFVSLALCEAKSVFYDHLASRELMENPREALRRAIEGSGHECVLVMSGLLMPDGSWLVACEKKGGTCLYAVKEGAVKPIHETRSMGPPGYLLGRTVVPDVKLVKKGGGLYLTDGERFERVSAVKGVMSATGIIASDAQLDLPIIWAERRSHALLFPGFYAGAAALGERSATAVL